MSDRSAASRRAALRAQQEAEVRRKRMNRVMIVGFGVVAAVILTIVGIVLWQEAAKTTKLKGEQITPPNATAGFGVKPYGSKAPANAPKVVIWEDAQCPACKETSDAFGKLFEGLAKADKITVEYRIVPMLDAQIAGEHSLRAAIGATIADTFGKFTDYVDAVYANQPREGQGYTDATLSETLPASIGLTGPDLAKFKQLYDTRATESFVGRTYEQFKSDKLTGTPTIVVNGKQVKLWTQTGPIATDEAGLLEFLTKQG